VFLYALFSHKISIILPVSHPVILLEKCKRMNETSTVEIRRKPAAKQPARVKFSTIWKNAELCVMRLSDYETIRVCVYATMQLCNYASMQLSNSTVDGRPRHIHTYIHTYLHIHISTYPHIHIPIHPYIHACLWMLPACSACACTICTICTIRTICMDSIYCIYCIYCVYSSVPYA
jgi:hypothetical protein